MGIYDGLFGDEENGEGSVHNDKGSVLAPANLKRFLSRRCKLKFAPHGGIHSGLSEPYLDWTEGSACRKRYELLTKPLEKGKWGILILEPRGSGKSMGSRTTALGRIVDNPQDTHLYSSQTIGMAKRRVMWVKTRIANEYPHLINKENWSNEQFTVQGADPAAEDPTMVAGAPGKDVEGAHARNYWLDDIVSDKTNATHLKRRQAIEWFENLQKQFTPTTILRAAGTRHVGHNLWEEIIEHYSDEFEIHILGCYDEETGNSFYPWMDDDFLARQEDHDPVGFRLKYMNEKVASEDVTFEPSMLAYGDPPMVDDAALLGGKRLDPRLAVYMLTDTAQTDRVTKQASETVFIIIAKDVDDMRYICDIDIGAYNPGIVQERFLAMYGKWLPHGLRYATMEDRGPGLDYMFTIPKLAQARDDIDFVPAILRLKRNSSEDKDSRISACYPPFSRGLYKFARQFLDPTMFRIDARGKHHGVAAKRILNYSREGDEKKDFMDCLADEQALIDGGQACPAPTATSVKKTAHTNYEWSRRRAMGKLGGYKRF